MRPFARLLDEGPWGATWDEAEQSWRIALWSRHADAVEVIVCHRSDPRTPVLVRDLVRSGDRWTTSVGLAEVGEADLYGFRVAGRWAPASGHRFDPAKVVVDPYATRVWFPPDHDRELARVARADTLGRGPFGVLRRDPPVVRPGEGGRPPRPHRPAHEHVVMELHVRGATRQPSPWVDAERRGTYAGLTQLIPYVADLGVTAIELLPVHQTDPAEGNYWGYMPQLFRALESRYAAGPDPDAELCELIDACHAAGLEVLIDVVLNHTGEGGAGGMTYSLKGVDNAVYYLLRPGGAYRDDAGCGNVVRAGHPAAAALVLATLEHFADLGIDGFRFDLATILGRDARGDLHTRSPLMDEISAWATSRGVRLVGEPWDLAAYQLGPAFPGRDWAQWNGRFRDDVRSFLIGLPGQVPALQQRVAGSPDLFPGQPLRSVNFITCHDGFTLYDLVSYDHKHNEANGHQGRDGTDHNLSWNCGWEGDEGVPPGVLHLRRRQMRNALALLLLSAGTPMLLLGDEIAQTQGGNNNAYNQDDETTWIDWSRAEQWGDLQRFVRLLLAHRRHHPSIGRATPWGDDVTFYGVEGEPDVGWESRSLAWHLAGGSLGDDDLYVMANAWWEPLSFTLQVPGPWHVLADTAMEAPDDIVEVGQEHPIDRDCYVVGPRSVVVLVRPRQR